MTSVVTSDPRLLEELTLNAWPALETLLFDGWVLSFSDGYTRRANSIHPLYPSRLPLAAKIAACEAAYAARGQEAVFKLTSSVDDTQLDRALADLGYQLAATTSVQTAQLAPISTELAPTSTPNRTSIRSSSARTSATRPERSSPAEPDDTLSEIPSSATSELRSEAEPHLEPDPEIILATSLEAAWLEDFNRLTATPRRFEPTMRALLEKIVPAHTFASITQDAQTLSLVLAVAEHGYVGLFDIVVDSRVRNQGLGRRLVTRLLQWGQAHAATNAYLAVMLDNGPAIHLYAQLGFHEQYRYWYRHKPH
jgi:N-acetylglutamate synthase